jgi:hypothetical protein
VRRGQGRALLNASDKRRLLLLAPLRLWLRRRGRGAKTASGVFRVSLLARTRRRGAACGACTQHAACGTGASSRVARRAGRVATRRGARGTHAAPRGVFAACWRRHEARGACANARGQARTTPMAAAVAAAAVRNDDATRRRDGGRWERFRYGHNSRVVPIAIHVATLHVLLRRVTRAATRVRGAWCTHLVARAPAARMQLVE